MSQQRRLVKSEEERCVNGHQSPALASSSLGPSPISLPGGKLTLSANLQFLQSSSLILRLINIYFCKKPGRWEAMKPVPTGEAWGGNKKKIFYSVLFLMCTRLSGVLGMRVWLLFGKANSQGPKYPAIS